MLNFIGGNPLSSNFFAMTVTAKINSFFFILKFAGFHTVKYSQFLKFKYEVINEISEDFM